MAEDRSKWTQEQKDSFAEHRRMQRAAQRLADEKRAAEGRQALNAVQVAKSKQAQGGPALPRPKPTGSQPSVGLRARNSQDAVNASNRAIESIPGKVLNSVPVQIAQAPGSIANRAISNVGKIYNDKVPVSKSDDSVVTRKPTPRPVGPTQDNARQYLANRNKQRAEQNIQDSKKENRQLAFDTVGSVAEALIPELPLAMKGASAAKKPKAPEPVVQKKTPSFEDRLLQQVGGRKGTDARVSNQRAADAVKDKKAADTIIRSKRETDLRKENSTYTPQEKELLEQRKQRNAAIMNPKSELNKPQAKTSKTTPSNYEQRMKEMEAENKAWQEANAKKKAEAGKNFAAPKKKPAKVDPAMEAAISKLEDTWTKPAPKSKPVAPSKKKVLNEARNIAGNAEAGADTVDAAKAIVKGRKMEIDILGPKKAGTIDSAVDEAKNIVRDKQVRNTLAGKLDSKVPDKAKNIISPEPKTPRPGTVRPKGSIGFARTPEQQAAYEALQAKRAAEQRARQQEAAAKRAEGRKKYEEQQRREGRTIRPADYVPPNSARKNPGRVVDVTEQYKKENPPLPDQGPLPVKEPAPKQPSAKNRGSRAGKPVDFQRKAPLENKPEHVRLATSHGKKVKLTDEQRAENQNKYRKLATESAKKKAVSPEEAIKKASSDPDRLAKLLNDYTPSKPKKPPTDEARQFAAKKKPEGVKQQQVRRGKPNLANPERDAGQGKKKGFFRNISDKIQGAVKKLQDGLTNRLERGLTPHDPYEIAEQMPTHDSLPHLRAATVRSDNWDASHPIDIEAARRGRLNDVLEYQKLGEDVGFMDSASREQMQPKQVTSTSRHLADDMRQRIADHKEGSRSKNPSIRAIDRAGVQFPQDFSGSIPEAFDHYVLEDKGKTYNPAHVPEELQEARRKVGLGPKHDAEAITLEEREAALSKLSPEERDVVIERERLKHLHRKDPFGHELDHREKKKNSERYLEQMKVGPQKQTLKEEKAAIKAEQAKKESKAAKKAKRVKRETQLKEDAAHEKRGKLWRKLEAGLKQSRAALGSSKALAGLAEDTGKKVADKAKAAKKAKETKELLDKAGVTVTKRPSQEGATGQKFTITEPKKVTYAKPGTQQAKEALAKGRAVVNPYTGFDKNYNLKRRPVERDRNQILAGQAVNKTKHQSYIKKQEEAKSAAQKEFDMLAAEGAKGREIRKQAAERLKQKAVPPKKGPAKLKPSRPGSDNQEMARDAEKMSRATEGRQSPLGKAERVPPKVRGTKTGEAGQPRGKKGIVIQGPVEKPRKGPSKLRPRELESSVKQEVEIWSSPGTKRIRTQLKRGSPYSNTPRERFRSDRKHGKTDTPRPGKKNGLVKPTAQREPKKVRGAKPPRGNKNG